MFIECNVNPYGANIDDCIIRAIVKATNKDYFDVFDGLCELADKNDWQIDELRTMFTYMKELGWELHEIVGDAVTVKQFSQKVTEPCVVIVKGHATFTKDGNTYDTWNANRYKVQYVFRKRKS